MVNRIQRDWSEQDTVLFIIFIKVFIHQFDTHEGFRYTILPVSKANYSKTFIEAMMWHACLFYSWLLYLALVVCEDIVY